MCVFVPGLGMDSRIWTHPTEARVMGGLFPLSVLFDADDIGRTLYHDMSDSGYPVITWSPRRPVGPVDNAAGELVEVMDFASGMTDAGIILVGHSRGGLVALKVMAQRAWRGAQGAGRIRAFVSIAAPYGGSGMARWASFFAPVATAVEPLTSRLERRMLGRAMHRALGFLASPGVRELLPGSALLRELAESQPPARGTYMLSLGGTDPSLVRIKGLALNGLLGRVLPEGMLPLEMSEGQGDGLVAEKSSVMPFQSEHISFHLNHLRLLFDTEPRETVLRRLLDL